MARCESKTKSGQQCRNKAIANTKHCYLKSHGAVGVALHKRVLNFVYNHLLSSTFAAWLSLLITLVWNFHQEDKLKELTYQNNAMNYRPRLEVISQPVIAEAGFLNDSVYVINDTSIYYGPLGFVVEIKLVNKEPHMAKLVAHIVRDTLSGDDNIRKLLISEAKHTRRMNFMPRDDFFKVKEIAFNDTISISMKHIILNVNQKQEGVLHHLFLYENELGVLYDTYYWIRFRLNPIHTFVQPVGFYKAQNSMLLRVEQVNNADVLKSIRFGESNTSRYIYSQSEKEDIYAFAEKKLESLPKSDHFSVKISTQGMKIFNPGTAHEFWIVATRLSYTDLTKIENIGAAVWIDSTSVSIPKPIYFQSISFNVRNFIDNEITIPKAMVNEYNKQNRQLFKHAVANYETVEGISYRSELVERLVISGLNVEWKIERQVLGEISH